MGGARAIPRLCDRHRLQPIGVDRYICGVNAPALRTDPDAALPGNTPRRSAVLYLIAVLLLGGWLRGSQVHESLWVDELHTSWVVADGAGAVAARAQAGNQSPLYFHLVWCVTSLVGHHEWSLRLISLVAGTGLILAVYALVRHWSGSATSAVVAALLVAVSRDCVFYAQEARPYALLQLSAVGHAALFVGLVRRPTGARRAAFVCGAAWLFYLHYTSFLFLLAEAVCLARWLSRRRPSTAYRPRAAALDAAAIAALILPAARHLWQIAGRRENWSSFVDRWPSTGLQIDFGVFVLVPVVGVVAAACLGLRRAGFRWRSWPGDWSICWMSVPPLVAFCSTWSGLAALAMVRYLVVSLVGAIVFAALCHACFASRLYRTTLGAALIACAIGSSGMVEQWSCDGRWIGDRREAWDELSDWLNSRWPADRLPVVLCPGLLEDAELAPGADADLQEYCLFPARGIYALRAEPLIALATRRNAVVTEQLRGLVAVRGGVWIVVRARPRAANELVRSLSQQLAAQRVETRQFDGLMVVRLAKPAPR